MKYDFDTIIERRDSNSHKWDSTQDKDILPMWVADMDFATAPAILEAIQKRVRHGIFGYTKVPDAYYDAVVSWFGRRYNFHIDKEWILYTTGVIPALTASIKALANSGDKVLVQTPVYNGFFASISNADCEIETCDLIYKDDTYIVNFDELDKKLAHPKVKIMLLCNPHNPVGRAWTREELSKIGELCLKNGVIVISDEIHCDFVYKGSEHIPFGSISDEFLRNCITCTAPTKTFNLAGIQDANIIVQDEKTRGKIHALLNKFGVENINALAIDALMAAYGDSEEWLEELKAYLYNNYTYLADFFKEHLSQLPVTKLESTYLVWINCKAMKKSSKEIVEALLEKEKLWVNDGTIYGKAGEGFIRINIACPRPLLKKGLDKLKNFFERSLPERVIQ